MIYYGCDFNLRRMSMIVNDLGILVCPTNRRIVVQAIQENNRDFKLKDFLFFDYDCVDRYLRHASFGALDTYLFYD